MPVSRAARREPSARPPTLRAQAGDMLVIDQGSAGGIPRIGEIISMRSADGSPPYLVRWLAGEYESTILPGPGARIERRHPAHRAAA
jgi:Domain of unknown function (DUF1918)